MDMLSKMKDLLRSQSVCVLATVSGGQPHCSLMSYAADAGCRALYMVTFRNTKKYRNLAENPSVSILVDSRDMDRGEKRQYARALTVNGLYEVVEDRQKQEALKAQLLERHPHLKAMAEDPDAEVFTIRIRSMQLLEGVAESSFVTVD